MNLLPRSSKDFASQEYWEQFFKRRGERVFEWYGGYLELCGVLHKYIKPRDKVLVVGCGNSELSERLYDAGCQNLMNIDVSEVVIRQMNERNNHQRPLMSFQLMDGTKMSFEDSYFQAVLDKGTLDAILTDTEETTMEKAGKLLSEIARVLNCGGRYLCVSLAQAHVLEKLLTHFSDGGWMVRVHQILEVCGQKSSSPFPLPVFVFVMTKVRQMPGFPRVFEMMTEEEAGKPIRLQSQEQLNKAVKEIQNFAFLRNKLNQTQSTLEVSLELCARESGKSRYTFHVIDCSTVKLYHSKHFAIFIIPHGRETEWLFGSKEGRRQLAGSVGYRRLITVTLHRDQQYNGMESIKSELSEKVLELAPPDMPSNQQIPFLTAGGDIGNRTVQHRGTSQLSGEYVVEDIEGDDSNYFRRLVFLDNQNVIQSEAKLLPTSALHGKKKKKKKQIQGVEKQDTSIDKSYLCCEHHKAMFAGLALLSKQDLPISVLVIGLGGGSLSLFIHDYFPASQVEAVEIDPSVLDVACKWFGFSQDERMKVHVADGLVHINSVADKGEALYEVVMFDVDSKDTNLGMSCPPPAFIERDFLRKVKRIITPKGVFILNLVCRDQVLKCQTLKVLKEIFPIIYSQNIEEEVNEILFCLPNLEVRVSPSELKEAAKNLEKQLKRPGILWDKNYDLADILKSVKIV
ncbi:eEF1A lysine and N-terminal methyltransferase [Bombina bombina]|uniref:eEF1A lysine and N-terminal methyltransferase n=1 Tax=Bombina bombina TaxID=8345 RepID=UPI00235B1B9D|nr:eEF1A lysine and N-terminal methyltransferase [Bombina bombina]